MKNIIFDVGNVIIKSDQNITFSMLKDYGVPNNAARKFFDNYEYREFSRGNISARIFYDTLIQKHLGVHLKYEHIVDAHNKHLTGVIHKVVEMLSKLPREKLVFLTDTNEWQTTRERQLIDLSHYSDIIFRSHEIHMLKIDDGLFPYIIKKLNVKPEEIILIDDSIEKIEIAQKHGLRTHQFIDPSQLADYLISQDIL